MGAKSTNPMGTKWQQVDGELMMVTVGKAGVWGITPKQVVGIFVSWLAEKAFFLSISLLNR